MITSRIGEMLVRVAFYVSIIAFPSVVLANSNPIEVDASLSSKNISRFVEYIEDTKNQLTFKDIISPAYEDKWAHFERENPGFGYTQSSYWLRLTVKNVSDEDLEYFIQEDYPLIDRIVTFVPKGTGYRKIETGDMKPFHQRPIEHRTFVFPISIRAKSSNTYYFCFNTKGAMNFVLLIKNPNNFNRESFNEYLLLLFFYGAMFIMIIYNLFIFFYSRDIVYLYYVLTISVVLLVMMLLNGTAFQFLWPNFPRWTNSILPVLLSLTALFSLLFSRDFMKMKMADPFSYKVTQILLLTNTVVFLISLFASYRFSVLLTVIFSAIAVPWSIVAGFKIALKKSKLAYFYLVSWLLFLMGTFAYLAKSLGILGTNFLTDWSLQIGTGLQATLLSLGLAYRINEMRKQLKVLNLNLEEKVVERTKELHVAMADLKSTNRQLLETKNQLWGEMQLAKKIQTVLLPSNPSIEGFQIAAYMQTADDVGGDYYDVIHASDRTWLVIGDVSGHGVPAGLVMMMVQTAINVTVNHNPDISPSDLLTTINKTISKNIKQLGENKYMTLTVLAMYDQGAFCFAGQHQDIMIYRKQTDNVDIVETNGTWIGIVEDISQLVTDNSIYIDHGDTMLLYTDGITEAQSNRIDNNSSLFQFDMFGNNKLADILQQHGIKSPDDIKHEILEELKRGYTSDDDITMLIIKRL
ncbi:MAG: 7TM diverse intracellular signaling domain-containing protein [Myxococcota bacterium]|nr:7TM diverse intracellular signaling domain-containing protein [Myxococcota bacterium]